MSHHYKIIFSGPPGAGKTTAIGAISDIPPVKTDARTQEKGVTRYGKEGITVAMDYGIMQLPGGDKIHLYGTPGQERFNFMWEILSEGGLGLILLIDNARPEPLQDLRFFLEAYQTFIARSEIAIGVTRMDLKPKPDLSQYRQAVKELNLNPPIFQLDARSRRDVSLLIQALLFSLDPMLENA